MTTKGALGRSSLRWSIVILIGQAGLVGCSGDESAGGGALPHAFPGGSTAGVGTIPGAEGSVPATPGVGATPGLGTAPAVGTGAANGAVPGEVPGAVPGSTVDPTQPGGTVGTAVPGVPPPDEPSAGFVRRLTHIEYDNTIADLLGVEGEPSASFAADVAMHGFTNNSAAQNVTPTLTEQYIEAAEGLSRTATMNLPVFLGCEPAAMGEEACIQQFILDFGKRAWRRPLTTEEQGRALQLFNTVRAEYELAESVQLLVQFFLLSPQFGYLLEPLPAGAAPGSISELDQWQLASRLSYFLLGSMPDEQLFAAAEAGALTTPEAVGEEARRLLQLPRARERVGLFHTEWLRLRHLDRLQKDTSLFPDFDLSWGPMLREQVELFAQEVILGEGGTATDLLTASFTFVNEELAGLYGVQAPPGSAMTRVDLDPNQRAGLLTHAALLATLAHQNQTDPVKRGKFIREAVLCDAVPPPPPDLVITPPVVTPGATTRERFAQHQSEPSCAACHTLMDPIGLGFEHYDPIGQWRDMDNGQTVDATGEIFGTDVAGTFDGAIELTAKLAQSEQTMACFAKTWFRFALGRSERPEDDGALAVVADKFKASGFKMSELLVALTETNAFRYQRVLDPNVSALEDESLTLLEDETAMGEETP